MKAPLPRRLAGFAILAAAVALGGCVNLPSGGPADGSNGSIHGLNPAPNTDLSQDGIVVKPVSPGSQWTPGQIVSGFLAAAGADRDVARQYLTPGYSLHWKPTQAALVIDSIPSVTGGPIPSHVTGGPQTAQITVTSDHLETLSPLTTTGTDEAFTLQTAPGAGPYSFHFGLSQTGGKWRINRIFGRGGVPSESILLISNADFLRDYQPRNLYFPVNANSIRLVPYPVYIPDRPSNKGITKLVEALTTPPPSSSWLYRAVSTGFPPGTRVEPVQIHGNEAVITLSGTAARADTLALQQMEAQLVTTLTVSPYSPDTSDTGIGEVQLQIKNSSTRLVPAQFKSWLPSGSTGSLFYQSANLTGEPQFFQVKQYAVGISRHAAQNARSTVAMPQGLGSGPMNAIAVSPNKGFPSATFAGCRGKQVYVVPLFGTKPLVQVLPSNCSSLSWDGLGRLWVTAGTDVFILTESLKAPRGLQPTPVAIPSAELPSAYTFTSLKVAPDGVRVALIVHSKSGSTVYVTSTTIGKQPSAVTYLGQSGQLQPVGPDLDNPVDLTWWGSDHLVVLDQRHGTDQLYEVPLNGGQSSTVPTPPDVTSVTGDGSAVVVGIKTTEDGSTRYVIEAAGGLDGIWHRVGVGSAPAYPG
ncbi:MAG TPA: LpqB family beta-propeller domain-containing protein [Streptosporangiaceae bacterium]|nr:LpqB family beta-propeller domain-containing protein [Streptosporangiaceae bacterium]